LSDTIVISSVNTSIINISQVNIKELTRDIKEKKVTRLLKQIIENNMMLLNLQKQILELYMAKNQKRKRQ